MNLLYHTGAPVTYPQPHDPDSTLWYILIWDDYLAGEGATISSGSWSVSGPDNALTIQSQQSGVSVTLDGVIYAQCCRVLLRGGTDKAKYTVTSTIVTSAGETVQKSFVLRIGHQ